MKTVVSPNEKVFAITKKNDLKPDKRFRLSAFTVPYSDSNGFIMKNIFSGEVMSLSQEEFSAATALKNEPADLAYLEKHGISGLARHRFIVEEDYSEPERYRDTVKLVKIMQNEKPGLKTYTILPTTACNARCTYCYEEGYAVHTMTQETVDRLIDYICETKQEGKITLSWFGGEPLVCAKTITYICKQLESRGVEFKSRMITNGTLMTKELAHEAKEVWKLGRVQVSLDGDRRDYTERKRYIDPVRHNYDTALRAIRYLADEGIKVNLRVNFDRDSIVRLRPFLDEMKSLFGSDRNVKLYLSALYQEKSTPDFIELERQMFELERYIRELGINNAEREKRNTAFRLNSCMADSLDKSVVIDPQGRLFNCEHLPAENTWGNIFDGVTDRKRYKELCAPCEPDDKCRSCEFLPQCTPFYKKGCPGWFETCREYQLLKTEYELRAIAEKLARDTDNGKDI